LSWKRVPFESSEVSFRAFFGADFDKDIAVFVRLGNEHVDPEGLRGAGHHEASALIVIDAHSIFVRRRRVYLQEFAAKTARRIG